MFAVLPSAGSPCQNPRRQVSRLRNSQRELQIGGTRTCDFSVSVQRFLPHSQQYGRNLLNHHTTNRRLLVVLKFSDMQGRQSKRNVRIDHLVAF
jgi:hypothetical protein